MLFSYSHPILLLFQLLKIFSLRNLKLGRNIQSGKRLWATRSRNKELTLPTARSPGVLQGKVLVGSYKHGLRMLNLCSVGFGLTKVTQAQELLYKKYREASNTIAVEVFKIPTFDELGKMMLWSCWLQKNCSLLPLLCTITGIWMYMLKTCR